MPIAICPKCGARNRIDENAAQTKQPVCGRCGTKLAIAVGASADGHPVEVSDATLQSILQSAGDKPVLIDAWAAWCGPCRMIAPTIDQLAAESAGRWVIAKLDVDKNPQTATQYRIDSIPALLIFKNGQLKEKLVGVQPKQNIAARLAVA